MDSKAYIQSGMLEQYCLGLLSGAENVEVQHYAARYADIKQEIDRIADAIDCYARSNPVHPKDSIRMKVLLAAYQSMAGAGKEFPPLIADSTVTDEFRQWMKGITVPAPSDPFDNLTSFDLPSTESVTNFMVWVKNGHDEEEHSNFREFIVILEGDCDMYMNGEKKHFTAGEIICIPPFVPHRAVITSEERMVAIVQRQQIAA